MDHVTSRKGATRRCFSASYKVTRCVCAQQRAVRVQRGRWLAVSPTGTSVHRCSRRCWDSAAPLRRTFYQRASPRLRRVPAAAISGPLAEGWEELLWGCSWQLLDAAVMQSGLRAPGSGWRGCFPDVPPLFPVVHLCRLFFLRRMFQRFDECCFFSRFVFQRRQNADALKEVEAVSFVG